MAKLTIRDLASVDVDLWGKQFETIPVTRTVEKKIGDLERRLRELGDGQTDEIVELTAQVIDLRLKPAGNGRKKASELIVEKWQADALTLSQLLEFATDLGQADRPI